uniref:Large ribosomal subunit protein uL29m n=1 Tax=Arcella intermedia TaxID=1963864 RepID=A0A6B2LP51_9EUKA
MRQKCFEDLHKLWFVLLKEKNMLLTQREEFRTTKDPTKWPNPYRLKKVKLSMARIKVVLGERKRVFEEGKLLVRKLYAKQKKEEQLRLQQEELQKTQTPEE